ncbi:MAG: hypothetical protein R8G34_00715 [Paracoccaceae bacterium]|nr:hypothetical protein [Paracoccaceae bacterium]
MNRLYAPLFFSVMASFWSDAAAAEAICEPLNAEVYETNIESLGVGSVGIVRIDKNGQTESAHPITPFGWPFTIELETPVGAEIENRVSVLGRWVGDKENGLEVLTVDSMESVSETLSLNATLIAPENAPHGILNHWWPKYSLLVLGCEVTVGSDGTEVAKYVTLGKLDRRFSTRVPGWAIGLATLSGLLGLFWWYVRSLKNELDPKGKNNKVTSKKCAALAFTGVHDRLSLTKVQMAIFFVVIFGALSIAFSRTGALSDLSNDVLLLLGIAVSSAAAARLSDRVKSRLDYGNWTWLEEDRGVLRSRIEAQPKFADLVRTNGQFDLSRFQALAFTPLVAIAFATSSLYSLDTATIPENILQLLGLSQVAYIAGKSVAPPTMKEFDQIVTEYRELARSGKKSVTDAEGNTEFVQANPTDLYFAAKGVRQAFNGAMGYPWKVDVALPSKSEIREFAVARGLEETEVYETVSDLTERDGKPQPEP